jgi:hypothetical protein
MDGLSQVDSRGAFRSRCGLCPANPRARGRRLSRGDQKQARIAALAGLCFVFLAAGCGPGTPPPQAPPPANEAPAVEGLTMQGIDLYLHDASPTPGAPRKPTFWVHAEQFSMLENGVWRFEQARAVVYGDDAQEEAITLEAERGRFEADRGALLEGGVKAFVQDMRMDLSDIEWINPQNEDEEGVARSDQPLLVDSPSMQLKAGSLRLYPEQKQFVLTEVSGQVRFGRTPL